MCGRIRQRLLSAAAWILAKLSRADAIPAARAIHDFAYVHHHHIGCAAYQKMVFRNGAMTGWNTLIICNDIRFEAERVKITEMNGLL